jgi:hypothetical protein
MALVVFDRDVFGFIHEPVERTGVGSDSQVVRRTLLLSESRFGVTARRRRLSGCAASSCIKSCRLSRSITTGTLLGTGCMSLIRMRRCKTIRKGCRENDSHRSSMKWTLRISSFKLNVFESFQLHPTLIFPIAFPGKFQTEDQNEAQKPTTTTNRVCLHDNRTADRSMRDLEYCSLRPSFPQGPVPS